ncbi:MAG: MlaD family protein [Solirubrobacterales bacterium]
MLSRGRRRLLGIAMIAAALVVIVVAATRPDPFTDRRTVWALFDDVKGLGSIDRDIRIAGVNSGEIGAVRRAGDEALVELEIDADVLVHDDAQVALRPHTLFEGSAFVDLHPGSPSAPPIDEGGVIPRKRTRTYVSFDEALRVLREPVREDLRDLTGIGADALERDSIGALRRTLRTAPELTEELGPTARALQGPGGVELSRAIRGASETVEALALREADLATIAGHANRTLTALETDGARPLDRALAALPGPLEALRDRGRRIEELLALTDELAVELRPGLIELAPALRDLRPILVDATPALERAVPLIRAIGAVLRRATAAAPAFERLLRTLRPVQRLQDERVLPAMHRDSRLGLPTYMQLISAFTAGTAALRPYQTEAQGTLGDGHLLRLGAYFDQAGSTRLAGALPCDSIAQLAPELAAELEHGGFCRR